MKEYRDLLPVIIEQEEATLPEGFDSWGIKTVTLGNRTHLDYRWPHPGDIATCDPKLVKVDNTDPCPERFGDGLCVATDWEGMASGGIPARLLLLVAYKDNEVLGRGRGKLRTRTVVVVAQIDGEQLVRTHGHDANLAYADLRNAVLWRAELKGADLNGADLNGADLRNANLTGANLQRANLQYANLKGAHLKGANMREANLREVNLERVYSDKYTIWPEGYYST